MGYTICEINPANLPSNVSITMTPQLEALVQDAEYEAPVRKKPSVAQRLSAFALAALMAIIPAYAGCGNGPNGNGDAISPVPSGYNVSSNITPASGAGVGPDDDPLEIGVDTPALAPECSADADCAAEAASGLDVVIDATYDNGTPGNPGDDETVTVASHTGVPFDTYTSGTATLSAAHGGAGLADGEGIAAHVALTFTDSKGESHTIEGSVNYTYEAGSNPNAPVISCRVMSAVAGLGFNISCNATSPLGYDLYGNWTATITDSSGNPLVGPSINEEGIISGFGPGAEDVEMYNLHTAVHDGHGNTGTLDKIFYIDMDETTATVNDTEVTDIPEDLADDISANCGTGFNPALKSTPGGYTFEITRAADGAAAMTCVWTRIQNMNTNVSANMSATTTMYTPTGETFEEFVSSEPDSIQFEYVNHL